MAYYLGLDGNSTFTKNINVNTGDIIEIVFSNFQFLDSQAYILDGSPRPFLAFDQPTGVIFFDASVISVTFDGVPVSTGDVVIPDVSQHTVRATFLQPVTINQWFNRLGTKYFKGNIYSIKRISGSGVLLLSYNPTLSAEAGSTLLIDEVGGEHGTLVGFSADPFVYYYDFLNPADEDTTNDNCLVFDGVDDYVEIPRLNLTEYRVELDVHIGSSGTKLLLNPAGNIVTFITSRNSNDIRIAGNTAFHDFVFTAQTYGYRRKFVIEVLSTGASLQMLGEGVNETITTTADITGLTVQWLFRRGDQNNFTAGDLYSLAIEDITGGDNYFYDFNRSPATAPVVPELINGQNGTMIGFPEPSGYVKNASNEIIGYRFNGVDTYAQAPTIDYNGGDFSLEWEMQYLGSLTANVGIFWNGVTEAGLTLQCNLKNNKLDIDNFGSKIEVALSSLPVPINQASKYKFVDSPSGSFLYQNDVEVASGSQLFTQGNPSVGYFNIARKYNGSNSEVNFYNAIKITHGSAVVNNWDTTLGDDDEIIDTVGGNNADIINAPTAGYLPIIEKQVFTVGTGKDYPSIIEWGNDSNVNSGDHYPVALCYGTQELTGDFDHRTDFVNGFLIEGATSVFKGNFSDPDIAVITRDSAYTSWLIDDRTPNGLWRNLILDTGDFPLIASSSANKNFQAESVGFKASGSARALNLDSFSEKVRLISCAAVAENGAAVYARRLADALMANCVAYSTNSTEGALWIRDTNIDLRNSITVELGLSDDIRTQGTNVITGSNNVSQDISATTNNIGTQLADINTAFNDPANGDYRVLQTYADTNLVGQGWNGSDIGASFYFSGTSATTLIPSAISSEEVFGSPSVGTVSATDTVKVLRGSAIIPVGQTTLTLTNGVDYTLEDTDDTKWYFRITNNHFTGMGETSGGGTEGPDQFTVHPVQSGTNTVLTRADTTGDNRVDWEIIQYTGNTAANEFIVREKGTITVPNTALTQTVNLPSSIANADDVVILITGQSTTNTFTSAVNTGLFTAVRGTTNWVATRGKSNEPANLSYAVIEYTGSDYTVTQESFVASTAIDTHTLTTSVADITKTFIHTHYRYDTTASAGLDDCSVRVYLQDTTTLNIRNEASVDLALKQHHVYLVQNPNLTVQRYTGEMSGVGEEEVDDIAITAVSNLGLSSLSGLAATSTGSGSAFPRGFINFNLSAVDNVKIRQCDNGQTSQYAFEVIEWPSGGGSSGSTVSPSGIPTEEFFGAPAVTTGASALFPTGIPSEEAFGSPSVVVGAITLGATAIPSEEAFGTPSLVAGATSIQPTAIGTEEAFGIPNIDVGAILLEPVSIVSEEVFGTPEVVLGLTAIIPTGIISAEAFGTCLIQNLLSVINLSGIPSEEVFGRVEVIGGDRIIIPIASRATWNKVAEYLRGIAFQGQDNDVIIQWLRSEGYEGQYNDAFDSYLEITECYKGSLTDKYAQWKRGETPSGCWLLEGGIWNDNGSWIDTEFWED